jgi:hypothetical protein
MDKSNLRSSNGQKSNAWSRRRENIKMSSCDSDVWLCVCVSTFSFFPLLFVVFEFRCVLYSWCAPLYTPVTTLFFLLVRRFRLCFFDYLQPPVSRHVELISVLDDCCCVLCG